MPPLWVDDGRRIRDSAGLRLMVMGSERVHVARSEVVNLSDPAQFRALAEVCTTGNRRLRRDQAVVRAAKALHGMANGLDALYRIEDPDGEYWDQFVELGDTILNFTAKAIEACRAQAELLLELIAVALQLRLPVPPEPTVHPTSVRSEPDLAHAPPLSRVALLSDDVMAVAA